MNAIQPHELRLGNYIEDLSGNYVCVNSITAQSASDGILYLINSYLKEHFSPIPLTAEIFDKIKELNGEDFSFEWTKELGLYWDVWDGIYLEHIQNVHQFQNFYYMAENKELIVEL